MRINNVVYAGQNRKGLTFTVAAGAVEGDAVMITAAGTVGRGTDLGVLAGKLVKLEADGKGTVDYQGVMELPFTGVLNPGIQNVVVNGAGVIKANASGRQVTVIGTSGSTAVVLLH